MDIHPSISILNAETFILKILEMRIGVIFLIRSPFMILEVKQRVKNAAMKKGTIHLMDCLDAILLF